MKVREHEGQRLMMKNQSQSSSSALYPHDYRDTEKKRELAKTNRYVTGNLGVVWVKPKNKKSKIEFPRKEGKLRQRKARQERSCSPHFVHATSSLRESALVYMYRTCTTKTHDTFYSQQWRFVFCEPSATMNVVLCVTSRSCAT